MHCSHASSALALLAAATTFVIEAQADPHSYDTSLRLANVHRRHHTQPGSSFKQQHQKRISKLKKKRSCRASSSAASNSGSSGSTSVTGATAALASASASASASSSNSSTVSSSGGSDVSGLGSSFLSKNGIYWGFLPDDADAGGTRETMVDINSWISTKSAFYGWYAQAQSGTTFDGSQLLAVLDDVKASGAIFQPAVMPTGGWEGLTASDNSQAVAIANVMKQFTDQGIEVWLRFAHEVNWYQTSGTYTGTAADFQAGWAAVSAAIDEIAPDVKMFFTPNVASSESTYDEYYPTSGRVDIVGIDYYPSSIGTFVNTMKSFHDKYTSDTIKFALGETGYGQSADIATKLQYVEEITSAATTAALPNFIGASWFNYQKGYDFRIVDGQGTADTTATMAYFD